MYSICMVQCLATRKRGCKTVGLTLDFIMIFIPSRKRSDYSLGSRKSSPGVIFRLRRPLLCDSCPCCLQVWQVLVLGMSRFQHPTVSMTACGCRPGAGIQQNLERETNGIVNVVEITICKSKSKRYIQVRYTNARNSSQGVGVKLNAWKGDW
jgi:hypothetical protein